MWRYLAGMIRTQRLAQGELHAANSPARPLHSAAGLLIRRFRLLRIRVMNTLMHGLRREMNEMALGRLTGDRLLARNIRDVAQKPIS